jgi:hypothetical protein
METNSKKVLEAMPDFGKFMALASQIKDLSLEKMRTENSIKTLEAENFRAIMLDPKFAVDGKRMTVSYYENAYKFDGVEGNLVSLRDKLAEVQSSLDNKRNEFEIYKQMHDLFKTLVYQERVLT